MEKGLDVIQGGATYNSSGATIIGLAETVDSVTAIEELVFIRKKVPMQEMMAAIKADWEGYKKVQEWARNSSEKFGTDSKLAEVNARWLMDFIHQKFQSQENYRGGRYTAGYWSMTNHAGFGRAYRCASQRPEPRGIFRQRHHPGIRRFRGLDCLP